jgi:hypothetical protein
MVVVHRLVCKRHEPALSKVILDICEADEFEGARDHSAASIAEKSDPNELELSASAMFLAACR